MCLSLDIITDKLAACRVKSNLAGSIDELSAADGLIIWAYGCWSISCSNSYTLHRYFPRVIIRFAGGSQEMETLHPGPDLLSPYECLPTPGHKSRRANWGDGTV